MDVDSICAAIAQRLEALPVKSVPAVRALRKEFSRELKSAPAATILAVAQRFIDDPPHRWGRMLGYELVQHHAEASQQLDRPLLERLGHNLDNWADVDCFSTYLSGRAWRKGQITDATVKRWAKSPDRWWRRVAVVSTVPLNTRSHGGTGDTERTLAICNLVLDDRDDMVVKALSWALRELAEWDEGAVRAFVKQHEARLASRIKREVANKLRTGVKNPKD